MSVTAGLEVYIQSSLLSLRARYMTEPLYLPITHSSLSFLSLTRCVKQPGSVQ